MESVCTGSSLRDVQMTHVRQAHEIQFADGRSATVESPPGKLNPG